MSGPRFLDPEFLRQGVTAYGRFLHLMRVHPGAFVIPTYQIDLMWHSHILASSAAYESDCLAIAGTVPDHDDSVNDRCSKRDQHF